MCWFERDLTIIPKITEYELLKNKIEQIFWGRPDNKKDDNKKDDEIYFSSIKIYLTLIFFLSGEKYLTIDSENIEEGYAHNFVKDENQMVYLNNLVEPLTMNQNFAE